MKSLRTAWFMNTLPLLLYPAIIISGIVHTTQQDSYQAKIETNLQGNILKVNGLFLNQSSADIHFSYRLKSERTGKAGVSVNQQAGSAVAAAGQAVTLSQSSFSLQPDDSYSIQLEILDKDKVIAKDSIFHRGR
jgi:hypothetical protein